MLMDSNQLKIEDLYSNDSNVCFESVRRIKNSVIGSNRLKGLVLEQGIAGRLVTLMNINNGDVAREAMIVVASLAKGTEQHLRLLIEANAVPILLINTQTDKAAFAEASLRCLRTIFKSPLAPIDLIYSGINSLSSSSSVCATSQPILPHLLSLASNNKSSYVIKECIANILAAACQTTEHQNIMKDLGAVPLIAAFIAAENSNPYQVKLAALNWLAQLCYENEPVSTLVAGESHSGHSLLDTLYDLMGQNNTHEMQFYAAKCMTYIYRSNAIYSSDTRLLFRTLPTLILLCKEDKLPLLRAQAADELAYLTEIDVSLQQTASICDHLINSLSDMLSSNVVARALNTTSSSTSSTTMLSTTSLSTSSTTMEHSHSHHNTTTTSNHHHSKSNDSIASNESMAEESEHLTNEIRQAAFKAFASLSSNDEEIRKRIIETECLMGEIKSALEDSSLKVILAALRCLHSLSRSVQLLRTLFQEHDVCLPLQNLLQNPKEEVKMLASSILCNMLLEFSPSKQRLLGPRAIETLCDLTRQENVSLRLNGVWALMNMAYQADQSVKTQILNCLGTDQIFHLLSDSNVNILMKTLGLLRNLLSTKPHIDHIMNQHGKQIMPAIILILEGEHSCEVKEQALCILGNIADGDSSKEFIMSNEDILKKLTSYLLNSNVNLQSAATFCINNLIWSEVEGASARQERLKELSVPKILQQLLSTQDTSLFDRVKTALQQFNICTITGGSGGGGGGTGNTNNSSSNNSQTSNSSSKS